MTNTSIVIADLQSRWFKLVDLDRAQEVEFIRRLGVSLGELATALNCSPSLLTHLLRAARASIEDRGLARKGLLSTRALVRLVQVDGVRRPAKHHEDIAFERERAALQGCHSIENWLAVHRVASPGQSLLIENVRLYLAYKEGAGLQNESECLATLPTDRIAVRSKLSEPMTKECDLNAGLVHRFALWVLHAMPDPTVRQKAFELVHGVLAIKYRSVAENTGRTASPMPESMAIAA